MLPPEIENLRMLEKLTVRRNRLCAIPIAKLKKMTLHGKLSILDVGENPIETILPDLLEAHAAIQNQPPDSAFKFTQQLSAKSRWNHLKILVLGSDEVLFCSLNFLYPISIELNNSTNRYFLPLGRKATNGTSLENTEGFGC